MIILTTNERSYSVVTLPLRVVFFFLVRLIIDVILIHFVVLLLLPH